jgi:surface antigen
MAGPEKCRAYRLSPYSGTLSARLRWAYALLPRLAITVALGYGVSGCALSYKLDSIFGDKAESSKPEVTSGIAQFAQTSAAKPEFSDSDLAFARAAASEVLARGGKDASLPWENPHTGARGTVTPVAATHNQHGQICRDFLASYVRAGSEAWLQGEACRKTAGHWEVTSLKPWKRS